MNLPSPVPAQNLQPLQYKYKPNCSSYRVVERSCPSTFLEKLSRKPEKSCRQVAEEVRNEILQVCCEACRPLPGYCDTVTPGQRLELGLDCDEVGMRLISHHSLHLMRKYLNQ